MPQKTFGSYAVPGPTLQPQLGMGLDWTGMDMEGIDGEEKEMREKTVGERTEKQKKRRIEYIISYLAILLVDIAGY